jgi:hypothetical protein
MFNGRTLFFRILAALLLAGAAALPAVVSAHDIPNDVTIQSFVKAEGGELRLLVRAPLLAMRDMTWPYKAQDVLDLSRSARQLNDAAILWVGDDVSVFEGNTALAPQTIAAVRVTPVEDRSFESYETAMALLTAPQADVDVPVPTGFINVLFTYPIQSADSRFSIDPRWTRLGQRTVIVVRLMHADGTVRTFEFDGNPGVVDLDPRWPQVAWRFVTLGFQHILGRSDYLLFLFCVVIPFRRVTALVTIVAAFTIAQSITLIASAYDLGPDSLWFPPLVETLIAASIVYMALENILGANLHRRWLMTFGFALVQGFGVSFALKQARQFAGSHMLTSVLSFNIGVELAQLLILLLMIPAIELLFRRLVAERLGTLILSGVVLHSAWHWMVDRFDTFRQYNLTVPEFTPAFVAELLRYAMAIVAIAGVVWLMSLFTRGRDRTETEEVRG